MSDDLVDQLRDYGDYGAQRAADEIVRLRADFGDCYADLGQTMIKLKAAEAERDRLREALLEARKELEIWAPTASRKRINLIDAALKGDTP